MASNPLLQWKFALGHFSMPPSNSAMRVEETVVQNRNDGWLENFEVEHFKVNTRQV
jgi:hypothetical protein